MIDALGMTLMPGLVEGHAHLSFCGATKNTDLGDIPPEEHVIETLHNARKLLDAGFTSAYSAASAKLRLDVVVRNEVNSGRSPGPRIRAASPEITVTGGLGDENRQHLMRDSFAHRRRRTARRSRAWCAPAFARASTTSSSTSRATTSCRPRAA